MPPLRIEVFNKHTSNWQEAATMLPGDQYGSISDNTANGRDIYYFGIDMVENKAVIKKSLAGADMDLSEGRLIANMGGTSLVASLDPGEEYELTVKTDVSPEPRVIRFTHLFE